MASGRVGGTRSKIRGQVGNVIYQVVKNPDGTYTQISYGKPEDVTRTITPRLQAQRMCTSMVEALMRDLGPIGKISMQSAANKSKSLNAFSSYNLNFVAQDCKAHWYDLNQFYYPKTGELGTAAEQLGGAFMLSSGTWQFNGFDELVHLWNPIEVWPFRQFIGKRFCGMRFRLGGTGETVGRFLQRHYLTQLDSVCFASLHSWIDYEPDPDDPTFTTRHSYIIAQLNAAVPPESPVNETTLNALFKCESDWNVLQRMSDDGKDYYIGLLIDNENDNGYFHTYGGFTISYMEGKKKISSSRMTLVPDEDEEYFKGHSPAYCFGTWMGEPGIVPYPSPFV